MTPAPTNDLVLRGHDLLESCLRAVARDPRATALFCDIDGTISPIAPTPAQARVPEAFRTALAALAPRLGLLTFVTGREVRDGERMVSLPGATYVGTHGLQLMDAAGDVHTDPAALHYVEAVQTIAELADGLAAALPGLYVEDKDVVVAVHYRRVDDENAARAAIARAVVTPAEKAGLAVTTGKYAVEVRPPLAASKGTVTRDLLAGGDYRTALFLGDDLTDVSGFLSLHEWAGAPPAPDQERHALAVAAMSDETPYEVGRESDAWVDGPYGVLALLTRLATVSSG